MLRIGLLLSLLALTGCNLGPLDDRKALFGASQSEMVGSFRMTDYAVGQTYATRRELIARRLSSGLFSNQYYLSGNDSVEPVEPETGLFNWRGPEQANLPAGTQVKISEIQPIDKSSGPDWPQIFAEVQSGPLKGKRILLSMVSREHRFVDPEFLEPTNLKPYVPPAQPAGK